MPVHNDEIARNFEEIADLLEIEEANPFRIRAYRTAARMIRGMTEELQSMVGRGEDLTELPGIGKDLAAKINEIVKTGHTAALDKLHKEIPASLEELLLIPGLGPKRVKSLYQTLHIKSLAQLRAAVKQGKLHDLPGFGKKIEQQILDNLAASRDIEKRFLHYTATRYAKALQAYLQQVEGVNDVVIAGSYRRGKETVGDLDILVTASRDSPVMQMFVQYDEVVDVVSKGATRATVFLRCGIQVDVRVVDKQSFGSALHYFTGSKSHNIQIRRLAQQRGLKINEYGVFKDERRIAGDSEESVFKAVGLPFIPPELREGQHEIEAARQKRLPQLISLNDLQGDLHVHTSATDGNASIEAMALAAREWGLKYIAITDHSHALTVAHGLDERRLRQQIDEIDKLNSRLNGITVLKSCEVDILEDGRLDLPESILSQLDFVIGAVHSKFRLSSAKQTSRILRAMDSHYFTILAHPSGRLLQEREAYAVDMPRIIEAARQRGCYLELNSQPQRLDLTDHYCQLAKEQGVLVSVNSDGHSVNQYDYLQEGILQARRAWLIKEDVLNTRSLSAAKKLFKATMG